MTIEFRSDMTVQVMDTMGDDYSPIQAARVSTEGAESRTTADNNGLRRYLLREQHMVPFESQVVRFYIEAPIFVTRQILKHRVASISEESGRYKELEPVFYVPSTDRLVKQVGKTGDYSFERDDKALTTSRIELKYSATEAWKSYQVMLDAGVAKEVARMVLPLNTYSSMYLTINSRSLFNFFDLRTFQGKSKPQFEIALVADAMYDLWKEQFPLTASAWDATGERLCAC